VKTQNKYAEMFFVLEAYDVTNTASTFSQDSYMKR